MIYSKPLSYSTISTFNKCKRWFYLSKIENVPDYSDKKYADRGKIVHECLEKYYKNDRMIVGLKSYFEQRWIKYKLEEKISKDETWLMILNGIQHNLHPTDTEFKFYFPDINFVGYADALDSVNNIIYDYKSSSQINDDYKEQMKIYSYLYHKKFNRIPRTEVLFLKHNVNKLVYSFNEIDFMNAENEINSVWEFIKKNETINAYTKCCNDFSKCDRFCPYKEICGNDDNSIAYKLILTGCSVFIQGEISPLLSKGLDKTLSYQLPSAFFIKQATNYQWDGVVHLYDINKNKTMIGFKDKVIKILNDYAKHENKVIKIIIEDRLPQIKKLNIMPKQFKIDKKLRYYQDESVEEFLKDKVGIIEGGCSFGKTVTSAEIIRRLDCKTLFVIDRKELITQTKKEYEELLGVECGIVGMGEDDISKSITLATYQTLSKHINKYTAFLKDIDFVIFDEAHITSIKSIEKIHKYLINTTYRLGMTGTAFRDDKNDMKMFGICGPIIYKKQTEELIKEGWLVPAICKFIEISSLNSEETYQDSYHTNIVNNDERNQKVVEIINEHKDKKFLVLTKLIEHGRKLTEIIPGAEFIYGGTKNEKRLEQFKRFQNGELKILIGSASIFSKGINIPDLDVIINVAGNASNVQTIQSIGRVLRKVDGKSNAFYYDFFDNGEYHKKASKERIKILEQFGHNIEIISTQENKNNEDDEK